MLIEFRCTNLTDYDAATGRSSVCGERLIAPEEQIGSTIKCKKCGQPVEVPFETPRQETSASRRPAVAATKSTSRPLKKNQAKSSKTNELSLDDPVERLPTDVMTFEFEADADSNLNTTAQRRCPKCGNALENGRCVGCRFVERKYESSFLPLDKISIQPAGFQKYAGAIFNDGVSMSWILIGFHVLVSVLVVVLMLCALVVGGVQGAILAVLVGVPAVLYVANVVKGYSLARNPRAQLAWFQKPVWNMVLRIARAMDWQKYDGRYKGRLIIDKRNAPIVDDQIPQLDGLAKCQVLDLEGTLLTDAGLKHLYGLHNLHCLVVRSTKVTHEGVFRLQQSNPKMWIWE